MNKGIHTRGYLPHWDFTKSVQAITFRLVDSVPKSVIIDWKAELAYIADDSLRQKELHRFISKYEDAGNGEALLANFACANSVQNQLTKNHGIFYKLMEWAIMPNHVHVLIRLFDGSLSSIIQKWRGASAIEINRHFGRSGIVWAPDYYDRYIRDENHLHAAIAYIRNNPVKAGLCEKPEDWRFSSAGTIWSADFSPLDETQDAD